MPVCWRIAGRSRRRGTVASSCCSAAAGASPGPDLAEAARAVPERTWHVLGPVRGDGIPSVPNLRLHGWRDDVSGPLARASIVVGSGGDGVVAAVAAAGRRFVCLPQPRPFGSRRRRKGSPGSARRSSGRAGRIPANGPASWPGRSASIPPGSPLPPRARGRGRSSRLRHRRRGGPARGAPRADGVRRRGLRAAGPPRSRPGRVRAGRRGRASGRPPRDRASRTRPAIRPWATEPCRRRKWRALRTMSAKCCKGGSKTGWCWWKAWVPPANSSGRPAAAARKAKSVSSAP